MYVDDADFVLHDANNWIPFQKMIFGNTFPRILIGGFKYYVRFWNALELFLLLCTCKTYELMLLKQNYFVVYVFFCLQWVVSNF